jgi:hypothetical protein
MDLGSLVLFTQKMKCQIKFISNHPNINPLSIAAYLLKARTVEPEKQPLLVNGYKTTFISRQQLGKHVPAATDTHATIEVLLETLFTIQSVQKGL